MFIKKCVLALSINVSKVSNDFLIFRHHVFKRYLDEPLCAPFEDSNPSSKRKLAILVNTPQILSALVL